MVKIGIPRAGYTYEYCSLWKGFFEELGLEVVLSPETTEQIADNGVKKSDTNLCFAMKVYVGHVLELKEKVEYIFVPNMSTTDKTQFHCPYHKATSDLLKNMFPDLQILVANLEINHSTEQISEKNKSELFKVGKILKKQKKDMKVALDKAFKAWKDGKEKEVKEDKIRLQDKSAGYKIAIIGISYILKDKFCITSILEFLEEESALPIYLHNGHLENNHYPGFKVRWIVEQELINKYMEATKSREIDGIIYVVPFSCGPCFLFQEQVVGQKTDKPTLILHMDESLNQTLIKTRIEAFIDVIKNKK